MLTSDLSTAIAVIKEGGIIAYPTEAVYGLGCDPFNQQAVTHLLKLKERPISKGLIIIAQNWCQIEELIQPLTPVQKQKIEQTWPGPYTWLLPATERVPDWITGGSKCVAVRVTNHPIARTLCAMWKGPLVSTSANVTARHPALSVAQVQEQFNDKIDLIIEGQLGGLARPTPIRDIMNDIWLRK